MTTLSVEHLRKRYGGTTCLDDVSMTFEGPGIHALLGRNGAGKSTLLNIAANRVFPDSGAILLDGERVTENEAVQDRITLMSEDNLFPSSMRMRDIETNVRRFAGSFDAKLANRMSEVFDMDRSMRFSSMSTGQRSVAKLIIALSSPADVVLLDEPVLGLDATNRDEFSRVLMETYAHRPRLIIVSTHLIEEISTLVESAAIIDRGRVVASGSVEDLETMVWKVSGPRRAVDAAIGHRRVLRVERLAASANAYVMGRPRTDVPDARVSPLGLQEAFVELTRRSADLSDGRASVRPDAGMDATVKDSPRAEES
ncbi:ABC transporter ATP-binding protein [uncultured Bifidobacterium sp.]|uniref:ATP-binding cassette domain-containing protein n=1 Tax=uncultured Bifidobacterium sp. TaxID=165187 RepID=UPI0026053D75|nr:ABC transporter ATP-binding protein [uncultured Bifidobacterium sp.]